MQLMGNRRQTSPSSEMVQAEPLLPGQSLPLLVRPARPDVDLVAWAAFSRDQVRLWLDRHGAVLFRGFGPRDAAGLAALLRALGREPLYYTERSSPRRQVSEQVFTSTEHPAHAAIPMHCENSYQLSWPTLLMFMCRTPADVGGETPLADTRRIRARLDPAAVRRFAEAGIMYRRCFDGRLGLGWQEVFGTRDREEAEAHCRRRGLRFTWRGDGALRTEAIRPFVDRHPGTGEALWFNHAMFFHPSSLPPDVRAALADLASEDRPSDALYGDGAAIPGDVAATLRAAYEAEAIPFAWQADDVLLLDNMLTAHGRAAYKGRREVYVAMG